jgi:Galactose oxidase, central domain
MRDELRRHFELTIDRPPPGATERVLAGFRASAAAAAPRRRHGREWAAAAAAALAVLLVAALVASRLGIRTQPAAHPEAPAPRAGAAVVYDEGRRQLVLFGGRTDAGDRLADTWTWDGRRWTAHHPPASPPALPDRAHAAYDDAGGTVVLQGYPSATWTWDGRTWMRHDAPGPATATAMAYDPATRTVLLYATPSPRVHETWSWDGEHWTRLQPAAMPDVEQGDLAFDGRQLLLTGIVFDAGQGTATWAWDGRTWARRTPALPLPGSASVAFAYDEARGRLVAFLVPADVGGVETWTWDGATWRREHPAHQPSQRAGAALVYDPDLRAVVLYGGIGEGPAALGDIWTWDGSDWTLREEATR